MRRIKKKIVAVLLSCIMAISMITGSYETANAAALAGYTAFEIIQGLLLSLGITAFTAEMIETLTKSPEQATEEWREIQAGFWADQMGGYYEEARKGGGSGPTPSPEPGKQIPSFDELMQNLKEHGKIILDATIGYGVYDCLKTAVTKLWDSIMEPVVSNDSMQSYDPTMFGGDNSIPSYMHEIGHVVCYYKNTGNYSYYTVFASPDVSYISYTDNQPSMGAYTKDGTSVSGIPYIRVIRRFNNKVDYYDGVYFIGDNLNGNRIIYSFNIPMKLNGTMEYPKPTEKKETIWVNPDLEETYKNNGKLELPQEAPQPLNIPTIEQLTELARKLNPDTNPTYAPELTPEYVQQLIDQLKTNPVPTVVPNPTSIPVPTGTPVDPDNPDDGNIDNFTADLTKVFPFCIPFDLVHLLDALDAEPEAPVFEIPIDIEFNNPFNNQKIIDYHEVLVIDLGKFEPVVKIFRLFQVIFFIVGLMMITRQQMIKG